MSSPRVSKTFRREPEGTPAPVWLQYLRAVAREATSRGLPNPFDGLPVLADTPRSGTRPEGTERYANGGAVDILADTVTVSHPAGEGPEAVALRAAVADFAVAWSWRHGIPPRDWGI